MGQFDLGQPDEGLFFFLPFPPVIYMEENLELLLSICTVLAFRT